MSEDIVVRQCAPTLAGLKTGSLFPCPYESKQTLMKDVRKLNQIFVPKGLCLLPMRIENGRMLLYLYRPSRLRRDLADNVQIRRCAVARALKVDHVDMRSALPHKVLRHGQRVITVDRHLPVIALEQPDGFFVIEIDRGKQDHTCASSQKARRMFSPTRPLFSG